MPNIKTMFPQVGALLGSTTATTSGSGTATSIPMCDDYSFLLDVGTLAGTTITLDVSIATSFDGGTTYYQIMSFSQATTTGQGFIIHTRPYLGLGEVATNIAAPNAATAQMTAHVVGNGPFDPRYMKVVYALGAATTSCVFAVRWIGHPPGPNT